MVTGRIFERRTISPPCFAFLPEEKAGESPAFLAAQPSPSCPRDSTIQPLSVAFIFT
jgi:hypothetical protein